MLRMEVECSQIIDMLGRVIHAMPPQSILHRRSANPHPNRPLHFFVRLEGYVEMLEDSTLYLCSQILAFKRPDRLQ